MTQEELFGLIGLLGGVGGSYFMGERAEKKAKDKKKQDILDELELAKIVREEEKKIADEEKYEADTKKFKREGRELEGDRRGELIDPGFFDMFGAEHDPLHGLIERNLGLTAADLLTGTTAYSTKDPIDQRIRNPESEEFVENRANNLFTDYGALPYAAALAATPLAGPIAARLGLGALTTGLGGIGSSMMANLSRFVGGRGATTPITDPSRLLPMYNDGGRVNYNMGTGPQGVSSMMAPLRQNVEVNDDPLTEALFGEMMGAQMSDNDEGIPISLLESMAEEQEMAKRDRLRELMQYFRD